MISIEWLEEYLNSKVGVTKDYKEEWSWDRYMIGGKMFASTCCPSDKYSLEYANHPLVSLKCDPLESEFLRSQYEDILPGFYMNKQSWISIRLDGEVPLDVIKRCCDMSYELTFSKLTKKLKNEIQQANITA